jgi:hypothetical protein
MIIEKAHPIALLDVTHARTPLLVCVLLAVTVALGVVSMELHWPTIPFNGTALFTASIVLATRRDRRDERKAAAHRQKQRAEEYARNIADIERHLAPTHS